MNNQLVRSNGASIGITWHTDSRAGFNGVVTRGAELRAGAQRIQTGLLAMTHASTESLAATISRPGVETLTREAPADTRLKVRVTPNRAQLETDVVSVLSGRRPVVSMDMRGQIIRGSRVEDDNEESFTMERYMEDFENVRQALNTEQLAIFAYSPGGFFATHYAIKHPQRVSALILAEPAVYTDKEDLTQRALLAERGDGVKAMEAMISYIEPGIGHEERRQLALDVVKDWQSAKAISRVFSLHAKELISDEMLHPLRKIPTLLIGGTNSPMNFHVKRIAAAVPEAHVWWVNGANHLDIVDAKYAAEIADVVDLFLRSL